MAIGNTNIDVDIGVRAPWAIVSLGRMGGSLHILLLHGDAEARLFADASATLEAALPHRQVHVTSAWATRSDLLASGAPSAPRWMSARGLVPAADARELLDRPADLAVLSLLPDAAFPVLRCTEGGAFVPHRGVSACWAAKDADDVASRCIEGALLDADEAGRALEPVITRLRERGTEVALCTVFRHVAFPRTDGSRTLRERIRRINLEAARLSHRTGCFVLDVDRVLAHEGGAALSADCFGGTGRAAELALDELMSLLLEALPEDAMPQET